MKVTVEFDEYETLLIQRMKREMRALAKSKNQQPPTVRDIVRGAVRLGVHSVYGEEVVADELLNQKRHMHLVKEGED